MKCRPPPRFFFLLSRHSSTIHNTTRFFGFNPNFPVQRGEISVQIVDWPWSTVDIMHVWENSKIENSNAVKMQRSSILEGVWVAKSQWNVLSSALIEKGFNNISWGNVTMSTKNIATKFTTSPEKGKMLQKGRFQKTCYIASSMNFSLSASVSVCLTLSLSL